MTLCSVNLVGHSKFLRQTLSSSNANYLSFVEKTPYNNMGRYNVAVNLCGKRNCLEGYCICETFVELAEPKQNMFPRRCACITSALARSVSTNACDIKFARYRYRNEFMVVEIKNVMQKKHFCLPTKPTL